MEEFGLSLAARDTDGVLPVESGDSDKVGKDMGFFGL
jgi:hypothetical protein